MSHGIVYLFIEYFFLAVYVVLMAIIGVRYRSPQAMMKDLASASKYKLRTEACASVCMDPATAQGLVLHVV